MSKKILLIPVAILLVVSLIACAAPEPAPAPAPTTTVTAPAATVTAPAATTTVTAPAPATTTAPAAPVVLPELHMKVAQAQMTKDTLTHAAVEEFAEVVNQRTDGKITWDVFGPEIGDWTELDVMATMGTIDVVFNAHDPGYDPRWNITSLPFAATGFADAAAATGPGAIFEQMGKMWAPDIGQYYLSTFLNNLGMLGLNHDPIVNNEQAAGVKIRCWPGETPKCYVAKMGFTPVTIPWAEAPTAIGTGIADGWVGSGSVYHWTLFRDVARTQMKTFDFMEMWDICMNLDAWNSMPAEYQTIFQEEAHRLSVKRLGQLEEEENEYGQKLIDYGWEVVDMAEDYPDEIEAWALLARECWTDLEPLIGKVWIDMVRAEFGMEVTR
ncbi:TRAP transporter substrate-binding protein DctP [Chloroflexota bacterium]